MSSVGTRTRRESKPPGRHSAAEGDASGPHLRPEHDLSPLSIGQPRQKGAAVGRADRTDDEPSHPSRNIRVVWETNSLTVLCRQIPLGISLNETGNDPSAGSPTETLLRLILPLNDEV